MRKKLLILAIAVMTMAPLGASAAVRGFVVVRRPYFGGFYGPFWGPYWGPVYAAVPATGQIKFDTKVKNARVFINGSYAGTTGEMKSLHLRPGSYNIEIKTGGTRLYAERVYVAPGRTLHLHPEL